MVKVKPAILAVVLAGSAVWALASIVAITDPPREAAMRLGVDTFEMMSAAGKLPAQAYDSF